MPPQYTRRGILANSSLAERSADNDCRRTVIHIAARAETPVDVIGYLRPVHRAIALVTLAQAIATGRFAAAIVVGNDVARLVDRVLAGTNPGNWRHFSAWRTTVHRATATSAKKTVDRTIAPVLAAIRVAFLARLLVAARLATRDRQQRYRCRTPGHHGSQPSQEAAP